VALMGENLIFLNLGTEIQPQPVQNVPVFVI